RRAGVPLDGGRPNLSLVPPERTRPGRGDRGPHRTDRRSGPAGTDGPARAGGPHGGGLGRCPRLRPPGYVRRRRGGRPHPGRLTLEREARGGGSPRHLVGLEIDWDGIQELFAEHGLPPHVQAEASRDPIPLYAGGRQVGKATSTTWSPTLKKMVALASVATS